MVNRWVEFHEEARAEYRLALNWYLEQSKSVAFEFAEEINEGLAKIAATPHRYPRDLQGTRRLLLSRFPFAIIYREYGLGIQVVAVAHLRRRPAYWVSRM